MKNINVALVRLLQFVVFVIFTFIVMVYFGTMILLPLDAVVLIIKVLTAVGFNGFIATFVAVPVIAYLGMRVYKMPELSKLIIDTGIELFNMGKAKIEAFNILAESAKA